MACARTDFQEEKSTPRKPLLAESLLSGWKAGAAGLQMEGFYVQMKAKTPPFLQTMAGIDVRRWKRFWVHRNMSLPTGVEPLMPAGALQQKTWFADGFTVARRRAGLGSGTKGDVLPHARAPCWPGWYPPRFFPFLYCFRQQARKRGWPEQSRPHDPKLLVAPNKIPCRMECVCTTRGPSTDGAVFFSCAAMRAWRLRFCSFWEVVFLSLSAGFGCLLMLFMFCCFVIDGLPKYFGASGRQFRLLSGRPAPSSLDFCCPP